MSLRRAGCAADLLPAAPAAPGLADVVRRPGVVPAQPVAPQPCLQVRSCNMCLATLLFQVNLILECIQVKRLSGVLI